MATILDAAFAGNFSIIFIFLFIYAIVYGLLEYGKPFGSVSAGRGLNALIALGVAVMAVVFEPVILLIRFMIPWFLVLALILFFMLFGFRIFGGEADVSKWVLGKTSPARTWIIVVTIIIVVFGLSSAFGQSGLEKGLEGDTSSTTTEFSDDGYDTTEFIEDTGLGNTGVTGTNVATDDFNTNVLNTIVNPKVLGLIFVLLVGVFAMFFLSD